LDIKIVEQHELARELVVVGCDFFTEQTQPRIAVALRQVAKDLVVGAVLLDDVNAILDRAGSTHSGGNRVVRRALPGDAKVRLHGRSEEHTSELQSRVDLVCRLLLEKKKSATARDKNV